MEFTPEFITEQGLSTEQVSAIQSSVVTHYDAHIATEKKAWDGLALTNAEKIIDDAVKATQDANNFTLERPKGEKLGEWNVRYSAALNETAQNDLKKSKEDYDEKVKNFQGDANLKAEIITLNDRLDPLLKDKAAYDELLGSGVQDKYDALIIKSQADTISLAYGSVKPAFHKDVDSRIVNYEWEKFVSETQIKYNLEFINNEWVGVEKDNKHAQKSLKDLIKGDEELTKLIDGRKQEGFKADEADVSTVEGVPFGVPKDVSNKDLTALIHKRLATEGLEKLGHTAAEYSKRFKELNELARGQKTAKTD